MLQARGIPDALSQIVKALAASGPGIKNDKEDPMLKRLPLALCVILFASAPAAFCQADMDEVVCFGDSLTHNDLLWIAYGTSPDLYEADPMQAAFNKGAGSGDDLASYAIAGSESDDVIIQIDLFLFMNFLGLQDDGSLFNFEIGGNDILNNDGLLAANPPGQDPAADAVIDNLLDNFRSGLIMLYLSNPSAQLVVWTIPDVTLTPDLWGVYSPTEEANLKAHIEKVNGFVRWIGRNFPSVVVLDLYQELQVMVANPPVLFGHQIVPPPTHGDYDNLFADTIHPTAVGNAMLANGIIDEINSKWNDTIPFYTDEELADLAHIPH